MAESLIAADESSAQDHFSSHPQDRRHVVARVVCQKLPGRRAIQYRADGRWMRATGRRAGTGCGGWIPRRWTTAGSSRGTCPSACMSSCRGRAGTSPFCATPCGASLSHYRMAVRKKQLPAGAPDGSLAARLEPAAPRPRWPRSFDNGQTRHAGRGRACGCPSAPARRSICAEAKRNMDAHFDFVGLTEQFDLSLMLLRRVCGWKWRFYVPDNVAPAGHDFRPGRKSWSRCGP